MAYTCHFCGCAIKAGTLQRREVQVGRYKASLLNRLRGFGGGTSYAQVALCSACANKLDEESRERSVRKRNAVLIVIGAIAIIGAFSQNRPDQTVSPASTSSKESGLSPGKSSHRGDVNTPAINEYSQLIIGAWSTGWSSPSGEVFTTTWGFRHDGVVDIENLKGTVPLASGQSRWQMDNSDLKFLSLDTIYETKFFDIDSFEVTIKGSNVSKSPQSKMMLFRRIK